MKQNWREEFDKEKYYIIDKHDGQIMCLSGEKHFFLISANETIKQFISKLIQSERDDVIRQFATGEFIQSDIAKEFEKQIKQEIISEIRKMPTSSRIGSMGKTIKDEIINKLTQK